MNHEESLNQCVEDLKNELRQQLTDEQILAIMPAINHFALGLIGFVRDYWLREAGLVNP